MNKTAILILIAAAGSGMVVPKAAKADEIGFFPYYRPVQTGMVRTVVIPGGPGGPIIYTNSTHRMILVRRVAGPVVPGRPYKSHPTAAARTNRESVRHASMVPSSGIGPRQTGNASLIERKANPGAGARVQDPQPGNLRQFADQAKQQEANPRPVVINN
ncbi:MAG: hypothetical protein JO333_05550 [Verrucomicrobia bacterium]|nr:hypothetical protein [Verrucomicrobiota bacterium]